MAEEADDPGRQHVPLWGLLSRDMREKVFWQIWHLYFFTSSWGLEMGPEVALVGERAVAHFALVRFLSRMHTHMACKHKKNIFLRKFFYFFTKKF